MASTISPEEILSELHGLWTSLDREGRQEDDTSVLRACVMTLAVLDEETCDPASLGETIAALMPEHPARAISIRLRASAEHALSARVYAQCWKPFGQRRQICCEQVEITASNADLEELPSVLVPLAAPDLPLIVWCRCPRVAAMPDFEAIARLANRVIVDTTAFPDPLAGIGLVAHLSRTTPAGDLSWTRITRWRSVLAQVFENREYLARVPGISNVKVTWGGSYRPLAAYMTAWLENVLAGAGAQAHFETLQEGTDDLIRVEMSGEGLTLHMAREDTRIAVHVNDLSYRAGLSRPTDYGLMREELAILARDPVFEHALERAGQQAEGR